VNVAPVLEELQDAERELAEHLLRFGERHALEHDLYHTSHTLAHQCEQHLRAIEPFAERYSAHVRHAEPDSPGLLERLRRATGGALGRSQAAGKVLLRDLRDLYLSTQAAELMWVILVQVSQAARDGEMLQVAVSCHEAAEMRGKWLRTRIKESAPQVYSA
jgi:hypothetical protein